MASVLRGYSAPVRLRMAREESELAFLMANDSDSFNRWDAGQSLAARLMLSFAAQPSAPDPHGRSLNAFLDAFGKQLEDDNLDGSYRALLLTLPNESMLGQEMEVVDPDAIHRTREFLRAQIVDRHHDSLFSLYQALAAGGSANNEQQCMNRRRLMNTALSYLAIRPSSDAKSLLADQFANSDNMTDMQAALRLLADIGGNECESALANFYDRWHHDPLVLDKWFAVQAASKRDDTIQRVTKLTTHRDFNIGNPNRVRSLLQTFAMNQVRFHAADGSGYTLLTDFILRIDTDNPQLAARLVSQMNGYRRFEAVRQKLMREQLERIAGSEIVSRDLGEIVQRALQI